MNQQIEEAFNEDDYHKVILLIEKQKELGNNLSQRESLLYISSLLMTENYEKFFDILNLWEYKPYKYASLKEKISKYEQYKYNNCLSYNQLRNYYMLLIYDGNYEKGLHYINSAYRIFNEKTSIYDLILLYIRLDKLDEASKMLRQNHFSGKEYLKIGISFIFMGYYEKGEEYLNLAFMSKLNDSDYQIYKLYIKKLYIHRRDGKFISMRYEKFKEKYTLSAGDVVYVKKTNRYYSQNDYKSQKRPYLIWKVNNDMIYAFPLSSQVEKNTKSYILYYQNYLNFNSDRKVKDHIVLINEKEIEKVQERITKEDLDCIMKNQYLSIIKSKNDLHKELLNVFLKQCREVYQANKGDLIYLKQNKEEKKLYLVLDVLKENLILAEVEFIDENIKIKDEPFKLKYEDEFYSKKENITDEQKVQIQKLLENYTNTKGPHFGDLIKINDKIFLIVYEDDKYFVCKDKTIKTRGFEFKPIVIPKRNYYKIVGHYYGNKMDLEKKNRKIYKKMIQKKH